LGFLSIILEPSPGAICSVTKYGRARKRFGYTRLVDGDIKDKTNENWRERLTPEQFQVLREHGTERAGTSPLNAEKRSGRFRCAGCGQDLFSSEAKFESGTGWPSFWAPVDGAIATTVDRSFGMARTEVHCAQCGGHLGHVFPDGPQPTGLRYCTNGVALKFEPDASGNS
jgi:peptide-methionine (R)-S-oxide reductase